MEDTKFADFVVIGSGVAGSACVEELLAKKHQNKSVLMVSSSTSMKVASSYRHVGKLIQKVSLTEQDASEFTKLKHNFKFIHDSVREIKENENCIFTSKNTKIQYDKLIICSGSKPKVTFDHPSVYTLRDIDSIKRFREVLKTAEDVCVVGNGGIALELVYEIKDCAVHWVIKSDYVGGAFFDRQTAQFFNNLKNTKIKQKISENVGNNFVYNPTNADFGGAVGPNWNQNILLTGNNQKCPKYPENIKIYYKSNIVSIDSHSGRTRVKTDQNDMIDCDIVILAIGVNPNTEFLEKAGKTIDEKDSKIRLGKKGGIIVDQFMKTGTGNVYAAGDCAEVNLEKSGNISKWFQMYLWSQAMNMGIHAANCAINPKTEIPVYFDLFTHLTYFFGFKVCLLGLYNLQGIENLKTISYYRFNENEFIRVTLLDGKIVGAVMVGETEMEETIENLILSELDVSMFGEDIINPDIDICDYFD